MSIDPDDSSPSFYKNINGGQEYDFDFVVSYQLPDGESGVINLYLADAGGRQIQKEVTGTGDYEEVTISVTEFVPREQVGEGFYISTILRDSNDEFVEGDDEEYTVTAPGEPPSIDDATPPGDETIIVEKGETQTFEIDASDPDGDDLDYTWRLRKEAVGSDYQKVGSGSTHSQTFDVELDDGNTAYRLQVEVTDPYHSITYDWLIDVQKENNDRPPSVTRITPESSEFIANASDDVQFEIEATDQDADLDRVDWYVNGDKQITRNFGNDITTTDSKTFTFDTDGRHTVRAVVTDSNGNNDTATWNSALADLQVTNVELVPSDPAAGEPTDFRVSIENIGDRPAKSVAVNTFVDGELAGVPPTTDLAPGESYNTVLTGDYKFDEGSHTVSAVIDPDNNIPESNEDNNENTLETNIGAYDGYSVTLTDFDYSISASSHANSGVGRTENYNTSTTTESRGIADVSVGSRAGPIAAQSSSQGVALVGAKWEAPHSGDTKVGLTSSTTGSTTVTPDDYPLATNLGYSGRAVASQSIVIYDRTDNEIVKQSQTKLSDVKAPTTNEWLVDSAIKIVGTVGLGSTLSKKVGSKGGGFVAKGVADTVGGEIQSQLLSKATGLVVNDDHTTKVDRKSSMVVSFEAEKGHEYAIYQRVSAGTGTLGITERAVGAEVDIKSDVEEIQIYTDEQTGGPPNLQISQTPSRYVSDPDNAVVEAQAEFSDNTDTTPEIGFRLVSPDGTRDDWRYQSSKIKRFSLGDLTNNVQPGEYVVEFQARDPRTGIESEVISVPVTVTSDPQVELDITEETENGTTLNTSIKSAAPVESIELQTKQAGEWTSWQTVSPTVSPVYDSPGETIIRGRAIDVAGNRGEWNNITVVNDNQPPTADAGGSYSVSEGSSVNLDASGSNDLDGSIQSRSWTVTSGPGTISGGTYQAPNDINSDIEARVQLTVVDNDGATSNSTTTVTVESIDSSGFITGSITDTEGRLIDSTIKYTIINSTTEETVVSGNTNTGKYTESVLPGSYEIIFSATGYTQSIRSTNVRAGMTSSVNTVLQSEISITTGGASAINSSAATLEGTLATIGGESSVEVGITVWEQGKQDSTQRWLDYSSKSNTVTVSRTATGLEPDTTYVYRIEAIDSNGFVFGATNTFTTDTASKTDVTTGGASAINSSAATLEGTLATIGGESSVEVGITVWEQGKQDSTQRWLDYSSKSNTVTVSRTATGLEPDTTYVYRIEAIDSNGFVFGETNTFTTDTASKTDVTTGGASAINSSAATLEGTLATIGGESSVEVGITVWEQGKQDSTQRWLDYSSKSNTVTVSRTATGLEPDTTYVYRIEAIDSNGFVFGETNTFTTDTAS